MKEKIVTLRNKATSIWRDHSKKQKAALIGTLALVILLIGIIVLFVSHSKFTPLYNHLSTEEVGQIKDELGDRNVPYDIKDNGQTIEVPEDDVDEVLVDLAGEGIPNSGDIDYSFFSENASWGVTDDEFDVMKLDATQTELAHLIQNIEGIDNADVMINMPDDPLYASESEEEASASVMVHTDPGYKLKDNQMESLYHLISKAIPNLPEDNIVIRDQNLEYYDQDDAGIDGEGSTYANQQTVKQDVEEDIQRRLEQMLGTMVGMDQVIVSVTADVDFTEENRKEELIDPAEDDEGLPVSVDKIHEAYSGEPPEGGTAGTGEEDVPGYEAEENNNDNGDYEMDKETINNEYNRIQKEIVESPYKVRDLGIQIAVDNVKDRKGGEVNYLSADDQSDVESGISSILDSIISSSIDEEYEDEDIDPEDKTSIVFQEFNERPEKPETTSPTVPVWMYVAGGILLAIIILLFILLMRSKKKDVYEEEEKIPLQQEEEREVTAMPEDDSEEVKRRKELEKMAQNKPEEFAKLLRSWMSEE